MTQRDNLYLSEYPDLKATAALLAEAFDPLIASVFRRIMKFRPDREKNPVLSYNTRFERQTAEMVVLITAAHGFCSRTFPSAP